jgi:hypothetical protein
MNSYKKLEEYYTNQIADLLNQFEREKTSILIQKDQKIKELN